MTLGYEEKVGLSTVLNLHAIVNGAALTKGFSCIAKLGLTLVPHVGVKSLWRSTRLVGIVWLLFCECFCTFQMTWYVDSDETWLLSMPLSNYRLSILTHLGHYFVCTSV
jgi:hypothetical protein